MKKTVNSEELLPLIKEITENGGTFPLVVTGTSMTPTLYSERDMVSLVSPKIKKPKKYDIVLFLRNDGKPVLHRIIKKLPDSQFLINGDSQTWTETIDSSQIIAVTQSFRRKQKFILCQSFRFRLYSHIWCLLKPLRPFLFRFSLHIKSFLRTK